MKQMLSFLDKGENRDKERLSQLSNVNKPVMMEKEIGPRFPGFIMLNQDQHQVQRS